MIAPWSSLAAGCEQLGGNDWGMFSLDSARAAVRYALDQGITVFDTADVYGLGQSEIILSKVLGEHRKRVNIITKGGIRWFSENNKRARTQRDSSPEYITKAIENSLKRLRVETIPLYLIHWPDCNTPIEETIECLEKAVSSGRILSFGLSNFSEETIGRVARKGSISAVEGELNLLSSAEAVCNLLEARRLGLRTITYGPLAQGLLTGKYHDGYRFDATDRRHRLPQFTSTYLTQISGILAELIAIAKECHRTPAQVAIRWALQKTFVDCVIVGAKTTEQTKENLDCLQWSLSEGQVARIETARNKWG